jgi:hypothetical protein
MDVRLVSGDVLGVEIKGKDHEGVQDVSQDFPIGHETLCLFYQCNVGCILGPILNNEAKAKPPAPPPLLHLSSQEPLKVDGVSEEKPADAGCCAQSKIKSDANKPEILDDAERFLIWKDKYENWRKDYFESWSKITCACDFGYYTIFGEWVSGEDVRNGRAPEKENHPSQDVLQKLEVSHISSVSFCHPF